MKCPKCGHSFDRTKSSLTVAVVRLHKAGKSNQQIYQALKKKDWFKQYSSSNAAMSAIRIIIFRNKAKRRK